MDSAVWYVAATLSRAETYAKVNLERQGFSAFCPRFYRTRRHARRVERVLVPLFPGYIFVRFDRTRDPWRSINGTRGVAALVGASSIRPQPMPSSVIDALFSRCHDEVIRTVVPEYSNGQEVRLINGPFSDRVATVERLEANGRVRVLLDWLGGVHSIQINAGDLSPA